VNHVESSLAVSPHFRTVVRLQVPSVSAAALDDLGERGLHPCFFREAPLAVKRAFLNKFFSADLLGERRRLSAGLIAATVTRQRISDYETLRRVWYTNLLDTGRPLDPGEPSVREHRLRWAVFQSRQVQRTLLEVFLRCFELAVGEGCRSVDQVLD